MRNPRNRRTIMALATNLRSCRNKRKTGEATLPRRSSDDIGDRARIGPDRRHTPDNRHNSPRTVTTTIEPSTTATRDLVRDAGFNWGLLGLLGLAPMSMRKDRESDVYADTSRPPPASIQFFVGCVESLAVAVANVQAKKFAREKQALLFKKRSKNFLSFKSKCLLRLSSFGGAISRARSPRACSDSVGPSLG